MQVGLVIPLLHEKNMEGYSGYSVKDLPMACLCCFGVSVGSFCNIILVNYFASRIRQIHLLKY
jgi:hypothetical protein